MNPSPFPASPLIYKAKSAFLPSESPGFQTRRCQCWRAQSWGWSSSSRCSWTSVTGRAREAGRASTSWSMSLRGALKSSLLTLTHMGSKPSRWMSKDQRTERRMQCFLWCHGQECSFYTLEFSLLYQDVVGQIYKNNCCLILGMCALTQKFVSHRTYIWVNLCYLIF